MIDLCVDNIIMNRVTPWTLYHGVFFYTSARDYAEVVLVFICTDNRIMV